jgi:hypothetical protein
MAEDVFAKIAQKIIEGQEAIIGPVAVEQAQHVPNLEVDWPHHQVTVKGNQTKTIDTLIAAYEDLFGRISVEVCKEAAGALVGQLKPDQLPEALK